MIKMFKQIVVIGVFGLIIVGVISVRGLYNPTRTKLLGKWNVTFEMTQSDLREMGVTTNPLVAATASVLMKTLQAEMQVEFRRDNTMRTDMSSFGVSTGDSGTWKVGRQADDGVNVVMRFDGDDEPKEWKIHFVDDDTFEMTPPEGSRFPISQLVVFRRVTEVADASGW
ncbi:MAG: hypothetical protein CMJ64_01320 [Planctomycetaceae bacterium]|nr:hypothetical protein [Planctomycetaceae bacterium]